MLKYRADLQSLLYMLVATALPVMQWQAKHFSMPLFFLSLVMAFAVGAMHHNHAHVPMWHSRLLNRLTDLWFTFFQGYPGYLFVPAHVENHHRYRNGERDFTRTYRHRDDNNLFGFLVHPLEFAWTLLPIAITHTVSLRRDDPAKFRSILFHHVFLAGAVAALLALDWRGALLFVIVPQAVALFFLLASNYLQHAHADPASRYGYSRNFVGLINPLFFNVGYHTAHHENGDLHWSRLREAHAAIADRIDPRLIEKSFIWYCLRVFGLSLSMPAFRSSSLRQTRPES